MKHILISILIIILIILIYKNKETFAIFYNKDDEENKTIIYKSIIDLPNKIEDSLLTNSDINDFKTKESTIIDKKDNKINKIKTYVKESSQSDLKKAVKTNLQNDQVFIESIKGDQGRRGISGISNSNTDIIAKNLNINNETLNREHVNYINDYHTGNLSSLNSNIIDIRKDKEAIDKSLSNGLFTDKIYIGSLDSNLSIRNEMDAIQIDKLNADLLNINDNNIYLDSNNKINIDKLKVDNLNVQDKLKINGESIFNKLKGQKGPKGDQGEKSDLPDYIKIENNKLYLGKKKISYWGTPPEEKIESTWSNVTGKINKLKGPDGNQGPPGDIGDKGDDFKLPDEIRFFNGERYNMTNKLVFTDMGKSRSKMENYEFVVEASNAKGNKGPKGSRGQKGNLGDHGLYPNNVIKNGDDLTFIFDDPNNNLTTSLPLNDYKGDAGINGIDGKDGVNIYADSLNYDENKSRIEFTENVTFDTNKSLNTGSDLNYNLVKENDTYFLTLAEYLEIPFDQTSSTIDELKIELGTQINSLLGKDINIYDFYFQEIEIDGNNYLIETVIDTAKLLNIEIKAKNTSDIKNEIKSVGEEFTGETTFKNIIDTINTNKEFIYIYKSFGDKLYFNPINLSLANMETGFDNIQYKIQDIKDNLKTISKIISYANKFFNNNTFLYDFKNRKYEAKTNFMNEIDTELNIFSLPAVDFTLDEKLYILNNFKLGHDQACINEEKCEKYCDERLDKDVSIKKYTDSFKCNKNKKDGVDIIPDAITNIYPNLDDLTSDAIFEINANKQNFLEDKLVVDFKSRLIFKMKNSNNQVINNIKTQNFKTFDKLNYWNLNGNYLETDVSKYKLTHDIGSTQIFVLRTSSFDDVNIINYADENEASTLTNPLIINNKKFTLKDTEEAESEYTIIRSKCSYSVNCEGGRQFGRGWIRPFYPYVKYLERRNTNNFSGIDKTPEISFNHSDNVPEDKKEAVMKNPHNYCYIYKHEGWGGLGEPEKFVYYNLGQHHTHRKVNYVKKTGFDGTEMECAVDPISDTLKNKWIFLAVKYKKNQIGTEIFLNSFEDDSENITSIVESDKLLNSESLYYHTINKPQVSGSNNGFDVSMLFSFNKELSSERINKIFKKIKEEYFY